MKYFLVLFILVFISCDTKIEETRKKVLWIMMRSENVNSIIAATEEIKKAKDTSMIDALLYNPEDPRITHQLSYYGMSVYQIKMNALKQVTGVSPPVKVTYEVDTAVIKFYEKLKKL